MKLAIVVQRYGTTISGGAELHARYLAEHLGSHAEIRVFTTCARDYVTWRNELPEGVETINGIAVERFPVHREREIREFARQSNHVFGRHHSLHDELQWLRSEGPVSPALLARLHRVRNDFDFIIFFSARYYHAYHGARIAPERAVLVPTAERDPALGLSMFQPIFRGVRALMYNSPEERALIHALSHNQHVPGVVVGVGSDIPAVVNPERMRQKFDLAEPFILYVGRIDVNKGCAELFTFFERYVEQSGRRLMLVLIGTPVLDIPTHPAIRHLGYVSDQDKFDALAASEALIMPSYYESLSMVALEAWALGRPVIANGSCDVLVGQCLRSQGGLYYRTFQEFAGTLDTLLADRALAPALGRNGREYYARHYSWPVIERTYLDMFEQLSRQPPVQRMEPLPGWMSRRRPNIPPAHAVMNRIPPLALDPPQRSGVAM